ncbi:MAG: hypothetical protein H7Z41_11105 [Cytophagales bacterium]|nr:hypothetical protein [Armatimonadota bacterium]
MAAIIGIGLAGKDCVVQVEAWERDEKTTASAYLEQVGGPVPVALMAMARLGLPQKPLLLSVIGGDPEGEQVSRWLGEGGIENAFLQRSGPETATCKSLVILDQRDASRTIVAVAAHLPPLDLEPMRRSFFAATRLLHLDGRDLPASLGAATIVRSAGGTVSLDLGTMRPGAEALLPHCDIILASQTGAAGAFPAVSSLPQRQVEEFLKLGATIAGVTLGKNGVVIGFRRETRTTVRMLPAISTPDAVDSCGAGDTFHGAFLWAYLQGRDPVRCAQFAQAAASLRIRRLGNRAGMPALDEVELLLRSLSPEDAPQESTLSTT